MKIIADIFLKLAPTTRKFFSLILFVSFMIMVTALVYAEPPWYLILASAFWGIAMYWDGIAEKDPELKKESFLHNINKGDS